jgi:hypothetical protein
MPANESFEIGVSSNADMMAAELQAATKRYIRLYVAARTSRGNDYAHGSVSSGWHHRPALFSGRIWNPSAILASLREPQGTAQT